MRLKRFPRKLYLFSVLLLLLLVFGSYYWFFQNDKQVDNGIASLQTVYKGHSNVVWQAKFHNDNNTVISAGVDGNVQQWTADGRLVRNFRHAMGVTHFEISPDGQKMVTASYDEQLRIWDLSRGVVLATMSGHAGTPWAVAWSRDGRYIASGGEDRMVRIWDAANGKLLRVFNGHERNVWAVVFSADGKYLVSSGFDKSVRIWNAGDGKLVKKIEGHTEAVVSLAINAQSNILATGGDDGKIRLWHFPSGEAVRTLATKLHHVYGLAFQPGGDLLLSGHLDKPAVGEALQAMFGDNHWNKGVTARLWNYKTGQLLQTLSGHANDVNDVAWNSTGNMFVTSGTDKTVQVWKLNTPVTTLKN